MKISTAGIVSKITAGTNVTVTGTPTVPIVSASGGGITALTGDVTASGTGSVAASVVRVNGAAVPVSQSVLGSNSSGQLIAGTGGGGAMQLILAQTLTVAGPLFSFTAIPQTFSKLVVIFRGRSTKPAGTEDDLIMVINSDNGTNYGRQYQLSNGSAVTAGNAGLGATVIPTLTGIAGMAAAGSSANGMGQANIELPFYTSTVGSKMANGYSSWIQDTGGSVGFSILTAMQYWNQTSAITRLDFSPLVGPNFIIGSSMNLYGIT